MDVMRSPFGGISNIPIMPRLFFDKLLNIIRLFVTYCYIYTRMLNEILCIFRWLPTFLLVLSRCSLFDLVDEAFCTLHSLVKIAGPRLSCMNDMQKSPSLHLMLNLLRYPQPFHLPRLSLTPTPP